MHQAARVSGKRSALALTVSGGLLTAVGLAGMGPAPATASSHREAPAIAGLPQYDATDLYAFRSPEQTNTVTLVANWLPFEEPAGGPNFYTFATDARYDINIDNDGDGKADRVLRWKFKDQIRNPNTFLAATGEVSSLDDENLNYYQTYTLKMRKGNKKFKTLVKNETVVPSDMGKAAMPDYQALRDEGITQGGNGKRKVTSFAGQADDPFFLDLRVFDLLYGGDFSEAGDDTLEGFGVQSVAVQVPRFMLADKKNASDNPVIGLWTTTDMKGVKGKYSQISRLGMPLVNEVVAPIGAKDRFNASDPTGDAQFLPSVTDPELARLVEAIYGEPAPETPRNDLVQVFLTGVPDLNNPEVNQSVNSTRPSEMLRLNMSTPVAASPDRLGVIGGDVQGFPNGRRLADDVIDIALQVVQGELVGNENDLGDDVDRNDVAFTSEFPYVALPKRGSDPSPHGTQGDARKTDEGGAFLLPSGFDMGGNAAAGALGLGVIAMMGGAILATRRRAVTA